MTIPLLLLPGLLCDEALWAHQTDHLADVAECIVTDMTQDVTMSGMARRILDNAPERFSLCGLSMGGYCALEIMRQAPQRVDRLALLDTSARPDIDAQTVRRKQLVDMVKRGEFETALEELLPLFIHPRRLTEGDFLATIQRSAEAIGPDAFLRQQQAIMSRNDSRPLLPSVHCPTLIMCGINDALTPPDLHEEMANQISSARLVVIDDCGHLSPLERPAAATDALRSWLLT